MKVRTIYAVHHVLVAVAMLSASAAFATHPKPTTPPATPAPIATATSTSSAGAKADSTSAAVAGAVGVGTGGDASASVGDVSNVAAGGQGGAGGEGGAGGNANAGANNEGNSLSVTSNQVRQAPSLGQGGLFVGDCGAGVNGGGSGAGGAGFLGVAWTPADCKLLKAAQAYQALGMVDAACEMVNGISAVKARWKALNVDPPKCAVKPIEPALAKADPKVDLSNYATKDDLNKAFRAAVGK